MQILAALAVVGLGLCAVVFAAGEQQSEDDTSSVRNLLAATRASITPMTAMKNEPHDCEAADVVRCGYGG